MEFNALTTIVIAVVFLALVGFVFFWELMRAKRERVLRAWVGLLELLQKRADKLPLLVEVACDSGVSRDESLVKNLIGARMMAWALGFCDAKKVQAELKLTEVAREFLVMADSAQGVAKNVKFLTAKKELDVLQVEIEKTAEGYNELVRAFNKTISLGVFAGLSKLFRFARLNIFEFEGF